MIGGIKDPEMVRRNSGNGCSCAMAALTPLVWVHLIASRCVLLHPLPPRKKGPLGGLLRGGLSRVGVAAAYKKGGIVALKPFPYQMLGMPAAIASFMIYLLTHL
jgi:hypothetical protein